MELRYFVLGEKIELLVVNLAVISCSLLSYQCSCIQTTWSATAMA